MKTAVIYARYSIALSTIFSSLSFAIIDFFCNRCFSFFQSTCNTCVNGIKKKAMINATIVFSFFSNTLIKKIYSQNAEILDD